MKKISALKILMLFSLLLCMGKLGAQVTIGAETAPKPHSVLELFAQYETGVYGGLRLPQLTTTQRNGLSGLSAVDAYGLMIYNLDNNCVEYWNRIKWVSLCHGTANITLIGDPCNYDPDHLAPADGIEPECIYTPVDDPACVVVSGSAYQVYLTVGAAYTTLSVDEQTSAFSLTFAENNSASIRIAIVRVVNNCSGEYQEFIFKQAGADCPLSADPFTLASNTLDICGENGAVIAYITNPEPGMNYMWVFGNGLVKTGNYLEITKPGKYFVYAGLIGCETVPHQELVVTKTGGTGSYGAPVVTVTNSGILCGSGSVILTANYVTEQVKWFHNGNLHGSSSNPLIVSGAGAAGEWFAVQQNGTCASRASNIVNLIDQTGSSAALDMPVATVNGTSLLGNPVICKNGTLELRVTNASNYPAGTVYQWFNNGVSIYHGTDSVTYYVVNSGTTVMTLSVQVSNNTGCPNTAVSAPISVTYTASERTSINNGSGIAAICGSNPAVLMALNNSGTNYQWFKDGVVIAGAHTSSYSATQTGAYTVRYEDANGCWSQLSTAISVIQSAAITLNWQSTPDPNAIVSTQTSLTVLASPVADSYSWSNRNSSITTVTQIGTSNTATIDFLAIGIDTIRVEATNACGMSFKEHEVTVGTGCVAISTVTISPNTTVTKNLDVSGNPVTGGDASTTFTATATNGSPVTAYEWYVNGALQGATSSTFVFNTPLSAGSYTIYAAALNGCTASNTAKTQSVTVQVNRAATPDLTGNYRLDGKMCYDIKQTDWPEGDICMPLIYRYDDFVAGTVLTFDYTFINSAAFSDLTFLVRNDAGGVVASIAKVGSNTCQVTFKPEVYTLALGLTKISALTFTLVAQFKNNSGQDVEVTLTGISVQDCCCGCAVRSTLTAPPYNGWILFQCHNLGADQNKTIQQQMDYVPSDETDATVYGDSYAWGRVADGHQKRNSEEIASQASQFDSYGQVLSTAAQYRKWIAYSGCLNWRSAKNDLWDFTKYPTNNPCPLGWRIPTEAEWQSIVKTAPLVWSIPPGGQSMSPGSGNYWKWSSSSTPGWLVYPNSTGTGEPTLFLPAAGSHACTPIGNFKEVSVAGYYWSTTPDSGDYAFRVFFDSTTVNPGHQSFFKGGGASIRCMKEY